MFWHHAKDLQPPLLELLLTHLRRVDPEHKGILDHVDYGISELLKGTEHQGAIEFIEDLLLKHPEKLTLDVFDSATAEIGRSTNLTNRVITRWFLRGVPTLCESAAQIVGKSTGDAVRPEVAPEELDPLDGAHVTFVARKAIGYLFATRAVAAASFLISLMRLAPDGDTVHELGALLYDPLLMNYPGIVREYVTEQTENESGITKDVLDEALASFDEYLRVLLDVPPLPALHPSQAHLDAYRRNQSVSVGEALRTGRKKSPLLSLFKWQTMLYGHASIAHIYGGDGQPHRTVMPLARQSVSMELPRMLTLDHCGLDYLLNVFRLEQLCP